MTALDSLDLDVPPIETEADFLDALHDPALRWYALRRRRALTAAGILGALSFEALHPRGHDGKFINKWAVVRWFDALTYTWKQGIVRDIDPESGAIHVVGVDSNHFTFNNPKLLYARPTPKARMVLPNPGAKTDAPGFNKVGSQGGSNPGAFYEVIDAKAAMPGTGDALPSPDIGTNHEMGTVLRLAAEGGHVDPVMVSPDATAAGLALKAGDTIMVPRIDGTPNRYDVLVDVSGHWYKVPASGALTGLSGDPNPDLLVTDQAVFGDPGTARRAQITGDPKGVLGLVRAADLTADDVVAMVQQNASTPPVVGDKFYVKTMNVAERARNEALANDLYEAAGVAVPEVSVGEDGFTLSSKLIGEKVALNPNNPDHVKAARANMVFDAWLANWDAVGQEFDNMQVGPDGTVWRIDAGGALKYRAKGQPKGGNFGPEVGELDSLRNAGLNPTAAKVYGGITALELEDQAGRLAAITPTQITAMADAWDMPDVADILISRRKSILDQIGWTPPEPVTTELPGEPTSVYNPVEQTVQPGKPPGQVAVHNYQVAFNDLPKLKLNKLDLEDQSLMSNAVFAQHGGLWVAQSTPQSTGLFTAFKARNLITDEQVTINVYPGDEVLFDQAKDTAQLEDLADDMKAKWDLAVAEIATDSLKFDTIGHAMSDTGWRDQWPEYLQPIQMTAFDIDSIQGNIDGGWMDSDGPLFNGANGEVYEILQVAAPMEGFQGGQPSIILRQSGLGENDSIAVNNDGLNNTGPWWMPTTATAVAMYRARLQPAQVDTDEDIGVGSTVYLPGGGSGDVEAIDADNMATIGMFDGSTVTAEVATLTLTDPKLKQEIADLVELLQPTGNLTDTSPYTAPEPDVDFKANLNDKLGKAQVNPSASQAEKTQAFNEYDAAWDAYKTGKPIPATPTLDKLSGTEKTSSDPDATVVVGETEAGTDAPGSPVDNDKTEQAVAAAAPTYEQELDENTPYLKSLAPEFPLFTGDMNPDPDNWQYLIGQNVIVMHQKVYEDPAHESELLKGKGYKLSQQNGLGTVTAVTKDVYGSVWIRVQKADGRFISVGVGPKVNLKKYIVPVGVDPIPFSLQFKQNGEIRAGSRVVGEWWKPGGDPTNPLAFGSPNAYRAVINGNESITGRPLVIATSKKTDMTSAVFGMTRPVPDAPKKTKKAASLFTEGEIVKLKAHYAEKFKPEITAQVTAEMQKLYVTQPPEGQTPLADGTMPHVGQWVYSPKDHTWWQVTQIDPKLTGKVPGTNLRVKRFVPAGLGSKVKESFRGRSTMYPVEGKGQLPTTFLAMQTAVLSDGKKAGPGFDVKWLGGSAQVYRIAEVKSGGKDVKIVGWVDGKSHWVSPADLELSGYGGGEAKVVVPISEENLQDVIQATIDATLTDKVAIALAADMAKATPAKKKKGPITYPGPDGALIKQTHGLAEAHLGNGQALLSDGYAPQFGLTVRDKKGQQWVIIEIGSKYATSQKNSVKVIPVGSAVGYYSGKWRANSTMVVDHEAMLTDKTGKPLPRLKAVHGPAMTKVDDGAVIFRQDFEVTGDYNPVTKTYRKHTYSRYWAVGGPEGPGHMIDLATGQQAYGGKDVYVNATRVAIVDKSSGDQELTISTGMTNGKYGVPVVKSFVVHNPGENATALAAGVDGVPSAGVAVVPEEPDVPTVQPISKGDKVWFSDFEQPVTVVNVGGNKLVLDTGDGALVQVDKSQVTPYVNTTTYATKDGKEIVVGMKAKWNDAEVTITGITQDGHVTVDIPGAGEGSTTANALGIVGITSIPDEPPPTPTGPQVTLTDGTVVKPYDTITVNGQEAFVQHIWKTADVDAEGNAIYRLKVHYASAPSNEYALIYTNDELIGVPGPTPQPTPPSVPTSAPTPPPPPTGVALTGELPAFTGQVGGELPHPESTVSTTGPTVQPPEVTGATAALHEPGALKQPGTKSVMQGWTEAQEVVKQNSANKTKHSSVAYGIGDGDAVEDMLFHTQVLRDYNDKERTEVTFRLTGRASKKTRDRLIGKTGDTTTFGAWDKEQVDPKNLVPGDQIALRISQEKTGVLKPDEGGPANAVITTNPVLVGKGAEGGPVAGLDVYRAEVAFTNGETGVVELVSGHSKPFYRWLWDPSKVKLTNGGSIGLYPDAQAQGWKIQHSGGLAYPKGGGGLLTLHADQAKMAPTGERQSAAGDGHMLARDLNGAQINFFTTDSLNTLNGRVTISVPSDDPDAQAKISAAMEAVGLTPEMQQPPDAKKLAKMALDKVFTQFNPTFTRGQTSQATADDPSQVLTVVENAIGPQLRQVTGDPNRHVTLADISIRTDTDGRVEVLLSNDVARAVSARNGAKMYTHLYQSGADAVFASLTSTPGLMSTNERWSSGIWYTGMSSSSDHSRDSAQYVFTRPYKHETLNSGGSAWYMAVPADTVHRMVDHYYNEDDGHGKRSADNTTWLDLPVAGSSSETMVKRRFDSDLFGRIVAPNETQKQEMVKRLKDWGLPKAPNGADWETFIVASSIGAAAVAPPSFGDEITLPDLLAQAAVTV